MLRSFCIKQGTEIIDGVFSKYLDERDEISHLRKHFYTPCISELLEESDTVNGPAKGM